MRKTSIQTEIKEEKAEENKQQSQSLRPTTLFGYIGQEKIKESLKVYIDAAKSRNEPLDHVLFYGTPARHACQPYLCVGYEQACV